ncbi:hypothetical protein PsorP6_003615 [Peronosclerospora sorghi]|uniref:Uncharacterized protein n=1 Tax=Peronosclerospora sorghi TaxID=230839 RepID=A0ACC0VQI4_9STRA|nr:hypothetical protein PsorP6_003615 [Peronosclerospora sorghi]
MLAHPKTFYTLSSWCKNVTAKAPLKTSPIFDVENSFRNIITSSEIAIVAQICKHISAVFSNQL